MAEASAALGALTLLVNNASVFEPDEVETLTSDLWDRHFAVNLRAAVFLARDFARQVPDTGEGAVINIIDQRGAHAPPIETSIDSRGVATAIIRSEVTEMMRDGSFNRGLGVPRRGIARG